MAPYIDREYYWVWQDDQRWELAQYRVLSDGPIWAYPEDAPLGADMVQEDDIAIHVERPAPHIHRGEC